MFIALVGERAIIGRSQPTPRRPSSMGRRRDEDRAEGAQVRIDVIVAEFTMPLQSRTELTGTISTSFQRPLGNDPRLLVASEVMAPLPSRSYRPMPRRWPLFGPLALLTLGSGGTTEAATPRT